MSKRLIANLAINVIVFCVAAELLSLIVFHYQHGWLFYLDPYRASYELIPETRNQQLTRAGLHPYFGPTHKPGVPFDVPEKLRNGASGNGAPAPDADRPRVETNNFGFASPYNYPFVKRRSDQFVVGIFGGSVGLWFCQVGADRLMKDLKESVFFRNKELISLCLSHAGYKQPQQLLVLAYFLSIGQRFDLVINIDGFNEVALSSINDRHGVDISMPSFVHLDPLINLVNQSTLTPAKLHSLAQIARYKEQLNGLAERINHARFASVDLVLEQYYAIVSKRYRDELARFDKLPSNTSEQSIIEATPTVKAREGTAVFEDIASGWITSSILMNELLASRGVGYFHFLQPNQYYTTRAFSGDEVKVALSDQSPFKSGAEKGYPFLVAASESGMLKENHVNFFNAIHIFDRERAAVYMDNCCHYTLAGNVILADFIARSVLSAKGSWNEQASRNAHEHEGNRIGSVN